MASSYVSECMTSGVCMPMRVCHMCPHVENRGWHLVSSSVTLPALFPETGPLTEPGAASLYWTGVMAIPNCQLDYIWNEQQPRNGGHTCDADLEA